MRTILVLLILGAAFALHAAVAFAESSTGRPLFFGDGFDNTTCADLPRGQVCR